MRTLYYQNQQGEAFKFEVLPAMSDSQIDTFLDTWGLMDTTTEEDYKSKTPNEIRVGIYDQAMENQLGSLYHDKSLLEDQPNF